MCVVPTSQVSYSVLCSAHQSSELLDGGVPRRSSLDRLQFYWSLRHLSVSPHTGERQLSLTKLINAQQWTRLTTWHPCANLVATSRKRHVLVDSISRTHLFNMCPISDWDHTSSFDVAQCIDAFKDRIVYEWTSSRGSIVRNVFILCRKWKCIELLSKVLMDWNSHEHLEIKHITKRLVYVNKTIYFAL